MPDDLILDIAAFVRSVGVNKASPHALFLGAGASVSSGVPSAAACIWEWKRTIFLTKNPGLEAQFAEISLPAVCAKIQRWLDQQRRYPAEGSVGEYGFYIQACYPISEDRRAFFQEKIRHATPHIGYKLTVELARAELIRSVWTTNFDGLVARAAANSQIIPIEVGIECQDRLPRKPNRNELLCVSLHGDYRYDSLKNTAEQIREQEISLHEALATEVKDCPLIVIGYSGRDESVVKALEDEYKKPGTGSLFWCGFSDADIPASVKRLICTARSSGRNAFYVPGAAFDDVILRIALHCLEGDQAQSARALMLAQKPDPAEVRADFQLPDLQACALIKSNAFELTPPAEIYEFDLNRWPEKGKVWSYFDECTEGKPIVAAPLRSKGYAFGMRDVIQKAFQLHIGSHITRVPINDVDLRYDDSIISSMIRQALVRALAEMTGVETDGRGFLWMKEITEKRRDEGIDYLIHDAVVVYLRRISGRTYVVLKPTIHIERTDGSDVSNEAERQLKIAILGWQHNAEFNQALDKWRKRLFLIADDFEFPNKSGSGFRFRVRREPIFAKVTSSTFRRIEIPPKDIRNITQVGVSLAEPKLVFSNRTGNGVVTDPHPVRGILENQPFDYPLTSRNLATSVSIGVICPKREARMLSDYLQRLRQIMRAGKHETDYLPDFLGFERAFGTAIDVPDPDGSLWEVCPEIPDNLDGESGARELGKRITSCIGSLRARGVPQVMIVFIPGRWAKWRAFETDTERFDLHNFVKAFCVPQGIATQFLEEDTLTNPLQCRIRWWLALALYVKSMRTPWVLDSLDAESAFVGLGVSIDRKAEKGNHIILGCSHLYNAQGEGLQFRLSKIENPIFRRRNPFMSFEDARRVGETIRQLFYESRMKLPTRVVVHKLTPFIDEGKKGLQAGLSGVAEIDLLEIYVDDALRYLSSVAERGEDGKTVFKADPYPVRRGTLLKVDKNTALLWVHGVSSALNPKLNYFQGKRRIPAPVVIKRHAGRSELTAIGEEVLGLSKMNWNSFDLYTKLPATVETSRQIAKIGSLLKRFGSVSYDYRLFM